MTLSISNHVVIPLQRDKPITIIKQPWPLVTLCSCQWVSELKFKAGLLIEISFGSHTGVGALQRCWFVQRVILLDPVPVLHHLICHPHYTTQDAAGQEYVTCQYNIITASACKSLAKDSKIRGTWKSLSLDEPFPRRVQIPKCGWDSILQQAIGHVKGVLHLQCSIRAATYVVPWVEWVLYAEQRRSVAILHLLLNVILAHIGPAIPHADPRVQVVEVAAIQLKELNQQDTQVVAGQLTVATRVLL